MKLADGKRNLKRESKKEKRCYVNTLQAIRVTVFERGLLLGTRLGGGE
jgi:hypothetical protein